MQLIIGYLATRVETKYGEDTIGKFAFAIGLAARTVRDYRSVYLFWYTQVGASAPFSPRALIPDHASYTHLRIAERNFPDAESALEPMARALDDSVSGDRWAVLLSGKPMTRELRYNMRRLDREILQMLEAANAEGREVYVTVWELPKT